MLGCAMLICGPRVSYHDDAMIADDDDTGAGQAVIGTAPGQGRLSSAGQHAELSLLLFPVRMHQCQRQGPQ